MRDVQEGSVGGYTWCGFRNAFIRASLKPHPVLSRSMPRHGGSTLTSARRPGEKELPCLESACGDQVGGVRAHFVPWVVSPFCPMLRGMKSVGKDNRPTAGSMSGPEHSQGKETITGVLRKVRSIYGS